MLSQNESQLASEFMSRCVSVSASSNCFSGATSWVETALFRCKFVCLKHETFPAWQAALETLRSEMSDQEKSLKKEIETLKKAGRDRERDLDTLNTVLQCNQDVINVRTRTHTHTRFLLHCVHFWFVS